jgi:[ribosomal protein S5]-alanine N-acetyltransferase
MMLETPHLRLVPNSPEQLLRLIEQPERLAELTGFPAAPGLREFFVSGEVSPEWLERLRKSSGPDPWRHGFFVVDRESGTAVGTAGFKGPPDGAAVVEIAYGIVPAFEGRGYATEAAGALVEFAFASDEVRVVRAHTLPERNASSRVLEKCGFRLVSQVVDPEDGPVWRWERPLGSRGNAEDASVPTLTGGPPPPPWIERHPILVGLGTLLTLHALVVLGPLQGMSSLKARAEPYFIGLVQLWYVLPLCLILFVVGWRKTLKVFALGALATFLINLAACAVFLNMLSHIH